MSFEFEPAPRDDGQLLSLDSLGIELDADDLLGLEGFDPDAALEEAPPLEEGPSQELMDVSRRISAQYVEIVELYAANAFASAVGAAESKRLHSALSSLERLALAVEDPRFLALVREASAAVEPALHQKLKGRLRDRVCLALREWLPRFGDWLGGPEGDRLRGMVVFEHRAAPLLAELGQLPGVGPKRLERLYCAGLFTAETLGAAEPEDVAVAAGIPRNIADAVVEAARGFAAEQRRRCVLETRQRVHEFTRIINDAQASGDPEMEGLIQSTLAELEACVALFKTQVGGEQ